MDEARIQLRSKRREGGAMIADGGQIHSAMYPWSIYSNLFAKQRGDS
jgi:hypothetical protein